jgi:hypothetical protein
MALRAGRALRPPPHEVHSAVAQALPVPLLAVVLDGRLFPGSRATASGRPLRPARHLDGDDAGETAAITVLGLDRDPVPVRALVLNMLMVAVAVVSVFAGARPARPLDSATAADLAERLRRAGGR